MSCHALETSRLSVLGHESHRRDGGDVHRLSLRVPADLRWLRGHFDDNPILPAVVQLWEVQLHVREIWPDLVAPHLITRTKFRRPIRPENRLLLRLQRTGDRRVNFELRRNGETCSSGTMSFRPPEDDVVE